MNRLLHAAARGARLQVQYPRGGEFSTFTLDSALHHHWLGYEIRVHPDDGHLAYGPISSALRELARNTKRPVEDTYWRMARDYYLCNMPEAMWFDDDRPMLHYSLFLLILSEELSEGGL